MTPAAVSLLSTTAPPTSTATGVPPPSAPGARTTAELTVRVALALLAAVAAVALLVRLLAAGRLRGWLGFPFTGVPATLPEAGRIFTHNASAMLGVFGLLLIAQLAARRPQGAATVHRFIQRAGELLLAGVIAANLAVVGAALGAYGPRMARAVLPHGPVELAAFALAIALYLQGRQRLLTLGHLAATTTAALALLAAAAVLEAMVTL